MILHSVNYKGPNSNYEWSIVTIHKSEEGARKAVNQYRTEMDKNNPDNEVEYSIIEIDTDVPWDCIYDYDEVDEIIDDDYDDEEEEEDEE